MKLYQIYKPITATPFNQNERHVEYAPCEALKPYIRCFWGTQKPIAYQIDETEKPVIITPDTCMDIIFEVDFTNNTIISRFCGICDETFIASNKYDRGKTVFTFAIRFYAWGVTAFSEDSMKHAKNCFLDVVHYFSYIKKEIEPLLFDIIDMNTLIPKVEQVLLKNYINKHENPIVLEAVDQMIRRRGNLSMEVLSQEIHISNRQLQRLFQEYVGVTPKNLASMIRYQSLWSEVLNNRQFDVQNAVEQFGYTDQAHLCREFKKYHTLNMKEAKRYALQNVGNLQEKI